MQLPFHQRNLPHHSPAPFEHFTLKNSDDFAHTLLLRLGVRLDKINLRCIRRWLIVSLVLWVVYGIFLHYYSKSVLGSCTFDAAPYRQHLFDVEGARVQQSLRFLNSLAYVARDEELRHEHVGGPKELCMVITTVDRHGARYLLQSAASILQGLPEEQRKNSDLLIVNADLKETTPNYQSDLDLLQRIPHVEVIMKREDNPQPVPFSEEEDAFLYWLAKERDDYVYGLDQCRRRKPKYIILFEDDVWAAQGWYTRLMRNVHQLEKDWEKRKSERASRPRVPDGSARDRQEQQLLDEEAQRTAGRPMRAVDIRREKPEEKDWALVKLYMAAQYDEYDLYLNNDDVAFFVGWGVLWGLIAIAAYMAYLVVARWRRRTLLRRTERPEGLLKKWGRAIQNDWNTLLCLFFIANIVPAALFVPICVNKQNFALTRKSEGIHPSKSRCCAQAQFFKNDAMFDQMVSCINANDYRRYPLGVDLLVSDCTRGTGGVIYETIPHLVQHTGIHSSSSVKRRVQDTSSWLPHMSVYFQEEE